MVAIIKASHSIRSILYYNENKVMQGKAELIGAKNYGVDKDKLSEAIKLNRFTKQLRLNDNVKCNSIHISLNFDISEGSLPKDRLIDIADTYMEKIGFGEQPYLVYQHTDAGHPHLHIASINIRPDGKRIDLHHLGIRKSEPARKEIEQLFQLVKAEDQKKKEYRPEPISSKVQYGRTESKKAIQGVLNFVVNNYSYASLPELNAVLKQYNVMANAGAEGSRVARHNGLLYHILDEKGKPIGVPIKASDLSGKPILKNLEKKFIINEIKRQPHKTRIKNAIDLAFSKANIIMLPQLITTLNKEGIATIVRQNNEGLIYGMTYVDHKTKSVFNGSALGKTYSAKGLQERCAKNREQVNHVKQNLHHKYSSASLLEILQEHINPMTISDLANFLEIFTKAENNYDYVTKEFKKKKNIRRKR